MISRKEVIMAMSLSEMRPRTLCEELNKYLPTENNDVQKFISDGVNDDNIEKHIAWILGLNKLIPVGWKPTNKVITPKINFWKKKPKKNEGGKRASKWNPEELIVARRMRANGSTYEEISSALNRTVSSIKTKLYRKKKEC